MKKLMKKISKTFLVIAMTMAMTFSFTVIPADAYSLENVVENETATITPVEDEFVGNAEKNIFSNAHFKVACSVPFTKITLNGQELALSPNKWTDINLSNVKAYLNEGQSNVIEVLFDDGNGGMYVGGTYEFIYDTTAPTLKLTNTNPNKAVIEVGDKYFEEYTVSDNVSASEDVKVELIYRYNNAGNYQQVDSLDKVGNYTVWYKITDEAGNVVTKAATREIDVVDTTLPTITAKNQVGSTVDGVNYYSYVDFKLHDVGGLSHIIVNDKYRLNRSNVWNDANYINLKPYYENEKMNTVEVFDTTGNFATYAFIYDIEKPVVDVQYSTTAPTNQDVVVTISAANELYDGYGGINPLDGWTKIDNQTYQKTFSENTSIKDLAVSDYAGNVSYVDIDVSNIDRTFGKTTLTYSPNYGEYTNGNVTVTLKCTEEIVTPDGWTKHTYSNGKVNYSKEFSENGVYQFDIYDLAGNKKTITVEINQIDRDAPVISGIENNKYYNTDVSYTIEDDHLDYVLINDTKYTENIPTALSNEGTYTISAVDKAGNTTTVTITIDKTNPNVIDLTQKYEAKQDGRIKVTVVFDEPVKLNGTSLWRSVDVDENGYASEYYGYFYRTKDITLNFEDRAGNLGTYQFTVDKTAPSAQVTYSTVEPTRNNVIATMTVSEDIDEAKLIELGWQKVDNRTFTKEYTQNVDEVVTIYDLVGNPTDVAIKITNIDKKVPEYKPDQWFITVEVDASAPNPYLSSEQVSAILEAQKEFISDDSEVTVVEDTWWNHNSSNLDIRKIGSYANAFSFYITDAAGNRINPRISVKVVDTTAPVIDLGDVEAITEHEYLIPFTDIIPTVTDNSGEALSATVSKITYATSQEGLETSSEYVEAVDPARLGWYKIEYSATDSSGNSATVSRIVHVVDTTAPTYTIEYSTTDYTYDSVTVTIKTSEPVTLEGWTSDETGTVFTKTYTANVDENVVLTDASGNTTTVNIKIENIVNKNNLEAFVERCSKLDQSKYSEESWAAYYPVYEASVEMLKVPHSQAEVDEQYVKLVTAYLGLRLIPDSGLIDK